MRVTIKFQIMPGPSQVESITLRVDTKDFADATVKALTFVQGSLTTVEVQSVLIERE